MLGAIAGDIIGVPFEHNPIKTTDFPLFSEESCFSDDTVLTLAVANWLMTDIKHSHIGLIESLRTIGRRHIGAGYGGKFYNWLRAENIQPPYYAFSNGCAMRVSPVGLYAKTLDEALELSKISAEVTHNHPEGIKGAQAIASCIYLCKSGKTKFEIKKFVESYFGYNLDRTIESIRIDYKFDVTCNGSVPEAIIAFLEGNSFEEVIRLAISLGGDSDTLAAMAGSIAACMYKIPENISVKCNEILTNDLIEIKDNFIMFLMIDSYNLREHYSKLMEDCILNTNFCGNHKFGYSHHTLLYIDRIIAKTLNPFGKRDSFSFSKNIISVVDTHKGWYVLTTDGCISELTLNGDVKPIKSHTRFISLASGYYDLLFALDGYGKIHILSDIGNIPDYLSCLFDDDRELLATAIQNRKIDIKMICELSDVVQISAGPKHVVCLLSDGTVKAFGDSKACSPLESWKNIKKIYVSQCLDGLDFTFGITEDTRLLIDGNCPDELEQYWKEIRTQHNVTDVLERYGITLVRFSDGKMKLISNWSKEQIDDIEVAISNKNIKYAYLSTRLFSGLYENYFHNYDFCLTGCLLP